MKSQVKAIDTVVIKDDFYDDPDKVRNQALTKSYEQPPGNTGRLAVTAVCNEAEAKAMIDLLKPYLPRDKENNIVGAQVLFRYTLANTRKKVFCHVDGCSNAGIVYLSKPEDCAGGTTIYRHKTTGDEIYNKANRHLYNFADESQWEILQQIDMSYNRLVMYPGQLFHAITPVFFGDNIENARLTQNVFVYRKRDNLLM